MPDLRVPPAVADKLGPAAADELTMMFADAHKLATESFERRLDSRIGELSASVDRRLADSSHALNESVDRRLAESSRALNESVDRRLTTEIGSLKLELTRAVGDLRFDFLKWTFLFWSTTMIAILGLLLRGG
jgi:hypothetical protein